VGLIGIKTSPGEIGCSPQSSKAHPKGFTWHRNKHHSQLIYFFSSHGEKKEKDIGLYKNVNICGE
jgi:hypothetical protein